MDRRVSRLDEFFVGSALCFGPASALFWALFAVPSTGQSAVLLACSAAGMAVGVPLLLGRRRRASVAAVQVVLAVYAVALCGVAYVLGQLINAGPFFSYLIWAFPPAFIVLPLRRAVLHSGWVLACIVTVEAFTRPDLAGNVEVARVGLILSTQVVAAAALGILATRARRAALRQRVLAGFGARALTTVAEEDLLADAHTVAEQLAGGPVASSPGPDPDRQVAVPLRPGDPSSPAWYLPRPRFPWQATGADLAMLTTLTSMTTAAQDRLAELNRTEHAALHDPLTGLPNRALGLDRLAQSLSRRTSRGLAVLLVDLDQFKQINDVHGHAAGDLLLQELGARLSAGVRPQDTVARLGGDEFMIIADDVHGVAEAEAVAERLGRIWERPYRIGPAEVFVTGSIGIALAGSRVGDAPDPAAQLSGEWARSHAAELLREADTAMYGAKARRRGGTAVYDDAARHSSARRLELEHELRSAVADGGFHLVYQPIADLRSGAFTAVETLLRWTHPRLGEMPPAEFVPIAEQLGLIRPLGELVLRQALEVARDWQDRGLRCDGRPIGFTVNVSPVQLDDPQFLLALEALVGATGLPAGTVGIEITEGVFLRDPHAARRILDAARDAGVRVLLDDFGTGYSSLAYLSDFAPDAIKIDRSFVSRLDQDPRARAIVRAVATLGRDLGADVVAEGIETADQRSLLFDLEVTHGQGFGLARPKPCEEVYALLTAGAGSGAR
ncbi:EAL domain-containing protein [Blastococcus sp. LR1]|uniref:putative bifunctional diguanylate cyclase/phosphodiesterase n=1 Tax=Blastococcus sp. LR1 TaxID=2877000 RepID=UPI001CCD6413|nr:EAL domain-containing protein [Blastococcus sp. LR1]MCA0143622.1 EAL domain-containing protein [Blastococcus sp. LR1]